MVGSADNKKLLPSDPAAAGRAHAADVSLDEITSNEILQWLRDEDLESIYVGKCGFAFREGDDLGWLAYFIVEVNLYEDSRYSGP
eukprot:scaffold30181_cov223-Skeletonema_menzelii.AAC.1